MTTESTVKNDQIVTTTIDKTASKTLNGHLSVKEQLLVALQEWATARGTNEIHQTVDDLVTKAKVYRPTASVTLATMAKNGEIELIKGGDPAYPRKITGFILKKAANPTKILAAGVEKAKKDPAVIKKLEPKILKNLVHVPKYLAQKEAINRAHEILIEADLEGAGTFEFPVNPMAEEAILLMEELIETTRLLGQRNIELEAARRAAPFLREDDDTPVI